MKRRSFLAALAAVPFAGGPALFSESTHAEDSPTAFAPVPKPRWRVFEITTRVSPPGGPDAVRLFLPLAQSAGNYQQALDLHWESNGTTERVHDARYGAPILHTVWNERDDGKPGETRSLSVVQTVATADRGASTFLPLTEAERRFWLAPTGSVPPDGVVLKTVAQITAGRTGQRERLRAIYDWVVDHTWRDPATPGCGTGNLHRNLASGHRGGKCADINGMLVGLARASGFPAREVYGLRVAPSTDYPCLGRAGDISKAQHCRAEVFLEEEGWFPVDPADVRKVVLEQGMALDSAEGRALRERMFGRWEMNWVGFNSATGIKLPGEESGKQDFDFLMYPHGLTNAGLLPCLDPAYFRYEISAREVTA